MMSAVNLGSFILFLFLSLFSLDEASAQISVKDSIMHCKTRYSDEKNVSFQRSFYIEFPNSNVIGSDGRIFFGGSYFYFVDGYTAKSFFMFRGRNGKLREYTKDDFERRSIVAVREGPYQIAATNTEANKPKATFDIQFNPSGLAFKKLTDWKGVCTQIAGAEDEIFAALKAKEGSKKL
jgi:hypothetical protein